MANEMKPNTRAVLDYLKDNDGKDLTAADVAEALSLTKKQVDGIFTAAFTRKGKDLGFREEVEITLPDESHQKVKYFRLTDKGRSFNPDAEV